MVALLFGHLSDSDREIQRLTEIVELELFLKMVPTDHLPTTAQLLLLTNQLAPPQCRHAPATGHKLFRC